MLLLGPCNVLLPGPAAWQVPAYASFIKERFERCLDLYLCPRTRRKRLIIEGGWGG